MPPDIFIFMGFIASGKSTLARAFAEKRGLPYYNSDVVRKEIAGMQAQSRAGEEFGKGIYSREYTRKTYDSLLDYAAAELQAGSSVVLDASYSRRRERKYAVDLAARFGAGCCFIFCQCSEETTKKRLAARARDRKAVSDADYRIYQRQKEFFEYPDELEKKLMVFIDTEASVTELLERLESAL